MPKPAIPTRAKALETFPNPAPHRDYHIHMEIPEFTCLCPKTGQPDFATIRICYVPDEFCVELKSLKLYFWSYRNEGAFHEAVTNKIAASEEISKSAAQGVMTAFASTADPDYQILLAAIQASHDQLERIKRFDMPGFQPNEHYLREMTGYGILPAARPPDQPVDYYGTDRAYWNSFIYRP